MAKKKSKNEDQTLARTSSEAGVLGANMRQVGTAIAGAVIGGVVEVALDKLVHKGSKKNAKDHLSVNHSDHTDSNHPDQKHPHLSDHEIKAASSTAKDSVENLPTIAQEAVQSLVRELAPSLPAVADVLKEVAQNSVQQSIGAVEAQTMKLEDVKIEGVVDTVKNAVDAINPLKSGKKGKKDKKNKKGKKGKKNKKS